VRGVVRGVVARSVVERRRVVEAFTVVSVQSSLSPSSLSSSSPLSPHFPFFFFRNIAFSWPLRLLCLRPSADGYGSPISATMSTWSDTRDGIYQALLLRL
jgi:hypothetical protein